jgi:hypothetical protein
MEVAMGANRRGTRLPVFVALVLSAAAPLTAAEPLSREAQARFLETARVVARSSTPKGVTKPERLTLSDGVTTHDAVFSTVDERIPVMRFAGGRIELDFVDSYRYSIAAYRLAVLLGMDDMIPVTVERRIDQRRGAVSWWIDDVLARRDALVTRLDRLAAELGEARVLY